MFCCRADTTSSGSTAFNCNFPYCLVSRQAAAKPLHNLYLILRVRSNEFPPVPKTMKIVLATRNAGKIREFGTLIGLIPNAEVVGLNSFPDVPELEETGATFAENARLKATTYSRLFGVHAIADDSGLEVAALDGRPGVHSARYAGAETKYDVKIQRLLAEIEDSDTDDRRARFVAHIAFASPEGEIVFEAGGVCDGTIASGPRGANGFGYDPIFIPDGYDRTFGELSDEVKEEISHRARATRKIMRFLRDFA